MGHLTRKARVSHSQSPPKKDKNYRPEPTPVEVPIAAPAKPGESFFVVMTLQEGPAPEVKVVKGAGLDAVVHVGDRRIRFDGEQVRIEDRGQVSQGN